MSKNTNTAAVAVAARRWATGPKQNHSSIEGPCAHVHGLFAEELERAGSLDAMNRKTVIDQAVADGVDIHTAKTQYQRARSNHINPKPAKVTAAPATPAKPKAPAKAAKKAPAKAKPAAKKAPAKKATKKAA